MVGQHADIVPMKSVAKSDARKGGKYLDTKGRIGIYDAKELKCEQDRERSVCKDYGGYIICEHERRMYQCKDCGGSSICEHSRIRSTCCKDCGWSVTANTTCRGLTARSTSL